MNILITGAEGSIGSYICNNLKERHNIFPFNKNTLDITNKAQCIEVINQVNPDLVIHAAALTNVDLCERDETSAYTINTIGCLNVAYPCSLKDIPILYLSCSDVYGGDKTSYYYETDLCLPVNVYGKTKLAGEKLIRTVCSKYFILRTSWVYGAKKCFVNNIIENKDVPIFMASGEISSPTYAGDLCAVIEKILNSNIYGIYNVTNTGAVKKSLWVKVIFDFLGIEKDIFEIPENFVSNKAQRPKHTVLSNSLIKNCFDIDMPTWESSLTKYLNSLK